MRLPGFPVLLLGLVAGGVSGSSRETPHLLRWPTVSQTQIAFSYAGDLWIVPREGGDARRLTSGIGRRDAIRSSRPTARRSPSPASTTATSTSTWSRRPAACRGASPSTRATTRSWAGRPTASASSSARTAPATRDSGKLFTIPVEGGFPTELPLPMADAGRPSRRTAHGSPTCRPCSGSDGLEALSRRPDHADLDRRPRRSRPSRRSRARTRTTSTRCGSAARSTSSPTATARSRCSPTTRGTQGR